MVPGAETLAWVRIHRRPVACHALAESLCKLVPPQKDSGCRSPPSPGSSGGRPKSIIVLDNSAIPMPSATITVDKGARDRLLAAKLEGGYRSLDALLQDLLARYRKKRLREAGELLRRKMKAEGLTLRNLIH